MIDQLIAMVRAQAGDAIIANPAIPNERNDEAIGEVANALTGGFRNALAGGQAGELLQLLGGQAGNPASHPLAGLLGNNVIGSLVQKFGLNEQQAGGIAGSLLPGVLQQLVSKTNDPNDSSIDLQGIFNSLTGGAAGGLDIQQLLSKVTSGGGSAELDQLVNVVKGNDGGQGGLMDMVKGLFGK